MRQDITEFIVVSVTDDGRVRVKVAVPDDPNGLMFSIVRDTYEECIAELRKFDSWMGEPNE